MSFLTLILSLSLFCFMGCGDSPSSSSSPSQTQTVDGQNAKNAQFNIVQLEIDGKKIDILNIESPDDIEKQGPVKVLNADIPDESSENLELRLSYPKEVNLIVSALGENSWHYSIQFNVRRSAEPHFVSRQDGNDEGHSSRLEKIKIIPFDDHEIIGGDAKVTLKIEQEKDTPFTFNLVLRF